MPRHKRIFMPGLCYHVYCRGNEKRNIFKSDEDRLKFVNVLKDCSKKYIYDLYAFALMPNHYHLLMSVPDENLWRIMKFINSTYASYFNWKHKRVGHLYEKRYEYQIVDTGEYLTGVSRYIHLNPYKAGLCEKVDEYPWTSYPEYCGKKGFRLAQPEWMYKKFGPDRQDAIKRYKTFVAEASGPDAVESNLVGGLILGSAEFARQLGMKCKDMTRVSKFRKPCGIISPEKVIAACAKEFGVTQDEVMRKKGKKNFAKSTAIYLIWKNSGMRYGEIGAIFNNLDCSSVKRTIARMKKELVVNRDFRDRLDRLEAGF